MEEVLLSLRLCSNGGIYYLSMYTWKFAANVDLVVAILHRKMIERGSVHVPLVLLK
jgi:hypothetical protein